MLVAIQLQTTEEQICAVWNRTESLGFKPHLIPSAAPTATGITGTYKPRSWIPAERGRGGLPIVVGPSHGTGRSGNVLPVSRACIAVGADGFLVEVRHELDHAVSNGPQSILPDEFEHLFRNDAREIAVVLGSRIN
jgi:hypothetical protein